MSSILLDGQIVSYETLGRGRPVIFLHSWVGSWRYWFPAMQVASKAFHAFALDMCGFGETSRDRQRYTIEHQTELLTRFLDEMGLGKVAIIGHGLGALVGFNLCIRLPQTIDRIMAISCPLYYDSIHSRMRTASVPDLVNRLGARSPEAKLLLADAAKADPQAIQVSIESFQPESLFGKMRATQVPCLLIYGQNDPAISSPASDDAIRWEHLLHQVVFEKSGHFPMIDEANRFNRLLMDFLVLSSGVSPRELR